MSWDSKCRLFRGLWLLLGTYFFNRSSRHVSLDRVVKSLLIVCIITSTSFMIFGPSIRTAHGALNLSTNPYDTYTQHWTGLRPNGNRELVNYNQRAVNTGIGNDAYSSTSAQLTVETFSLVTGDYSQNQRDQAKVGLVLNANSRAGLRYSVTSPTSFGPLSIPSSATDTGINCGSTCGAWVNIPTTLVYYSAPATSANYDKVWVCAYGYVSLTQDTSCKNSGNLGAGIIAPFSRSLFMDSNSHVVYWTVYNNGNNFFIAWNNMIDGDIRFTQNRETFILWIKDSSFSAYSNSQIEFLYNSITPSDGLATVVGIADQYGKRTVSVDPTTLSNSQEVEFKETSHPQYLNSFTVTITDTSNGGVDTNAAVVFDASENPVGYNMLLDKTVPDSSTLLPGWSKLTMDSAGVASGAYAALGLTAATAVSSGGLLLGVAALGIDTYDLLIHNYWDPKLKTQYSQTGPGDTNPAKIYVTAIQGGVTNYAPVDASLGAKLLWTFYDSGRNVPHHLTLTATVGYTDGSFGGADTWTATTNVDLDLAPDYKLVSDNFETGILPPLTTPAGADAWTLTTSCPQSQCYQGTWAAFAKETFNLNDQAILPLGSLVNYNQVFVNLHLWIDAGGPETLYIEYYSQGSWHIATSYNAQLSTTGFRSKTIYTQWINPVIAIPSSTTALRFRFGLPPGTTCCGTYGTGVYLDDIYVFGDGPGNSAQFIINSQTTTGQAINAVIGSGDAGSNYTAPVNFLEPLGTTHGFGAWDFTDNTGTYFFQQWSDGVTASWRSLTISQNMQVSAIYLLIPDFTSEAFPSTVTLNTASSMSASTIIVVSSRNGFSGQVSLSNSVSPYLVFSNIYYGILTSWDNPNVQVTPTSQGRATLTFTQQSGAPNPQTYDVTITGVSGGKNSVSNAIHITVNVVYAPPSGGGGSGGGGGGSVAPGSLITMGDGREIPVQNVRLGDKVIGVDVLTLRQTIATITQIKVVTVFNKLTIYTESGLPFKTDANPVFLLHVMRNGKISMIPVTEIHAGDLLFSYEEMRWVPVTRVDVTYGGQHTVYDLFINDPAYDFIVNGYADSGCKGCKL